MGWEALEAELDRWAARGAVATLWWRDDDAVAATPALASLLDLAAAHATPVALAVIPAACEASLHAALVPRDCWILQHGYAHRNHARAGEKARELGGARAAADVDRELVAGRDALAAAFGGRFLPVVVPPWNRVDADVAVRLAALGFVGVSTFGPRPAWTGGIVQCNTHVDPIAWRRGRVFVGTEAASAQLAAHLAMRRVGAAEATEPTGLLTHHLDFTPDAWRFVEGLLARTRRHPGARWVDAAAAFAPTCGPPA